MQVDSRSSACWCVVFRHRLQFGRRLDAACSSLPYLFYLAGIVQRTAALSGSAAPSLVPSVRYSGFWEPPVLRNSVGVSQRPAMYTSRSPSSSGRRDSRTPGTSSGFMAATRSARHRQNRGSHAKGCRPGSQETVCETLASRGDGLRALCLPPSAGR